VVIDVTCDMMCALMIMTRLNTDAMHYVLFLNEEKDCNYDNNVCVCCSHTTDILRIGLKLNKKQRNLYLFSRNLQPQTTTRQMKVASMKIYLT